MSENATPDSARPVRGPALWRRSRSLGVVRGSKGERLHRTRSVEVDRRLETADFQAIGPTIRDFGIAEDGAIILSSPSHLYAFGPGGVEALAIEGPTLQSFALDQDGTVLTIAGRFFGSLDEGGRPTQTLPLPFPEARLAPGVARGSVLMFGGDAASSRLYRVHEDGGFEILLDSQDPIVAVAESRSAVYVVTTGTLIRLSGTEDPTSISIDPGTISSIAVMEDDSMAFVATANRVMLWRGEMMRPLIDGSGGLLRVQDGRVFVLDQLRGLAYSLRPKVS